MTEDRGETVPSVVLADAAKPDGWIVLAEWRLPSVQRFYGPFTTQLEASEFALHRCDASSADVLPLWLP